MSWGHLPEVDLDGLNWPLPFAADLLGIDEKVLRKRVKAAGLEPAGTANMAGYRRSGRQPRVYCAAELIALHEQDMLRSGDRHLRGCGSVQRHEPDITPVGYSGPRLNTAAGSGRGSSSNTQSLTRLSSASSAISVYQSLTFSDGGFHQKPSSVTTEFSQYQQSS